MRKGEKFLNWGVPMLRRTLAPAPSDCSIARKALRIARATVMLACFLISCDVFSGTRGRS